MAEITAIEFVSLMGRAPMGRAQLTDDGRVRLINIDERLASTLRAGVIGSASRGRLRLTDGAAFLRACLIQFSRGAVLARPIPDAPVLPSRDRSLTDIVRDALHLDWDESLHPRDELGKFTDKDGGERRLEPRGPIPSERELAGYANRLLREAESKPKPNQPVPSVDVDANELAQARDLVAQQAPAGQVLNVLGPDAKAAFEKLFADAQVADGQLTETLEAIKTDLGETALVEHGPIKSLQRSVEKVVNKDTGHAAHLRDPVRASIALDKASDVQKVVLVLDRTLKKQGGSIVAAEDRFANPLRSGYRDLQLNIQLPNGVIGEVQVHVKSILAVKNGKGHRLYEDYRRLLERGDATEAENARMLALRAEMKDLYETAWRQAGGA